MSVMKHAQIDVTGFLVCCLYSIVRIDHACFFHLASCVGVSPGGRPDTVVQKERGAAANRFSRGIYTQKLICV